MSNQNTHGFVIGTVVVAAIEQVPDALLSGFSKFVLFIVTATVSGFAYSAGRWAWDRFIKRIHPGSDAGG